MYTWNADDYARHSQGQENWAKELLPLLELRPDDVVLDIGCGDGRNTAAIAEQVPQGRVVGVDLSADMVAFARERFEKPATPPNVSFMQASAAALPFDAEFTAVFSNATLHWVLDQHAAIAGIARALKPGGRFLAQFGGKGNGAGIIAAFEEVGARPRWIDVSQLSPNNFAFNSAEDYTRWLLAAGLEVIDARLIPKTMSHAGREALIGWLRSAWHPYTGLIPEASRTAFIDEVADAYLQARPPAADGKILVDMVRLQAQARKPARSRAVRSFVTRNGRITDGQLRALEDLWPKYGIDFEPQQLDLDVVFGRKAPRVVEIGFGNGDNIAAISAAHRDKDHLGIEVHRAGVGRLLLEAETQSLTNLRIICHDAVEVLQRQIPPASLDEVLVLFPDPWHKKRHHKRRLVQRPFVDLIVTRLKLDGRLRLATDWEPYAEQMLEVLSACVSLRNLSDEGTFVPRPSERLPTRFERRGERLGHGVWDLAFARRV